MQSGLKLNPALVKKHQKTLLLLRGSEFHLCSCLTCRFAQEQRSVVKSAAQMLATKASTCLHSGMG